MINTSLAYTVELDQLPKPSSPFTVPSPGDAFSSTAHSLKSNKRTRLIFKMSSQTGISRVVGDEKLHWTTNEEIRFLDLVVLEVRQGNLISSTFNKATWLRIQRQMIVNFGKVYTVQKLMAKFRRFRNKFRVLEKLIATPGMRWDELNNKVVGSDDDWHNAIAANKEFRQFRNRGCQYFNLFKEIFSTRIVTAAVATCQMAQMFTQHTVISEQNPIRVESSGNRHVEEDVGLSSHSVNNNNLSPFEMCINILQTIENVPSQQFFRAIREFSSSVIATTLFLRLNDRRRREWLDMLDDS